MVTALLAKQCLDRLRLRRHLLEDAGFNWIGRDDYEFQGSIYIKKAMPYDERKRLAGALTKEVAGG